MKILVGAACVAVIAFVSYFFWGEYQAAKARTAVVQQAKIAALQERGEELDFSGECIKIITEIVNVAAKKGTLTIDDVPYRAREDAAACLTVPNDGFVNHQADRLKLRTILAEYLN